MLKYDIVNALPYDIIRRIRQTFPSSDDSNDGKDSTYLYSKGNKCEIRISNHCTHLWTWHERKFGNNDDITRISIVFEQSDTFENKNLILRRHRKTPLRVMEFVYRISDPQSFTSKDVKIVIDTIKHCLKNQTIFKDVTGKLTYVKERVSINPVNENTTYKKSYNIKQRTPIFEHRIRCIIADTVRQVLSESFTTRRLGKYTVVGGDNKPHSVEGLEQYGNTLYDVAMYHSKNETLCLFSIGKNSHKFICCKLEYDKKYGAWLGFTPINYYDVPTLIKQDAKENLVKV